MDPKKIEKKIKKFSYKMRETKNIICSEDVKKNIVLCNVGQSTGMQREFIVNVISKAFPEMQSPKYIAEKAESYSFLVFYSLEDSKQFYDTFNGQLKDGNNTPVYMTFTDTVPNLEVSYPLENPKGLLILNDFITEEEEKEFLKIFDWEDDPESSNLKNRQVKHYGYEFRYGTNDVDLTSPLQEPVPAVCDILWTRLKEHGVELEKKPDQLTVNKYLPGQGIPLHVDRHSPFGGRVLSLSLRGDVLMDWRRGRGPVVPVPVPARSMMVMSGEARYDWKHGIAPRRADPVLVERSGRRAPGGDLAPRRPRLSLTLRTTRRGPCACAYPALCDRGGGGGGGGDGDGLAEVAGALEELHVHQVYERIAPHFSATRHTVWPRVAAFLAEAPPGALVVDLGSGNGKNIVPRSDVFQLACERSAALLAQCGARAHADRVRACVLSPPLVAGRADRVCCIAVVHHFCTEERRLQALRSISSLLRPGGRALVTVWARDQSASKYLSKTKTAARNELQATVGGRALPVHENRTQFQHSDLLVPWTLRDQQVGERDTLLRYYHVFAEGELAALCARAGGLAVERAWLEEGNWCVVCTKI